jgi:hypothetical protein
MEAMGFGYRAVDRSYRWAIDDQTERRPGLAEKPVIAQGLY